MSWRSVVCCVGQSPKQGQKKQKTTRRSISRVLSHPKMGTVIHLGRALRTRLGATYPDFTAETPLRVTPHEIPIWSCSGWGLPCHLRYRKCGALLPHRFTLASISAPRFSLLAYAMERSSRLTRTCCPRLTHLSKAVCSLWHFPWDRSRRALPGILFPWSPDFPLICMSDRPTVWPFVSKSFLKELQAARRSRRPTRH